MTKLVGLTGGIGSGKSTVAKIFISLGVPVFDSDLAGRRCLDEDAQVKDAVVRLLGDASYKKGRAARAYIAGRVFANSELLNELNRIVHPAVAARTKNWLENIPVSTPYAIKEAAILHESGAYKSCDTIICVTASESLRIARVQNRDNVNREEVLARMARQWSEPEKLALSQHRVVNDGSRSLIAQVMQIHHLLSG